MHVGRFGQLQEWLEAWDHPDDTFGHLSHLYGLFPSDLITAHRTPELFEAARTSLKHKGLHGGWPGGWGMCLSARLGDGDRAHALLVDHILRGFNPNLLNGKTYQLDGHMGAAAGIAEMLLQSQDGELHLLPALPKAWATGRFRAPRVRDDHAPPGAGGEARQGQTTIETLLRSLMVRSRPRAGVETMKP